MFQLKSRLEICLFLLFILTVDNLIWCFFGGNKLKVYATLAKGNPMLKLGSVSKNVMDTTLILWKKLHLDHNTTGSSNLFTYLFTDWWCASISLAFIWVHLSLLRFVISLTKAYCQISAVINLVNGLAVVVVLSKIIGMTTQYLVQRH